MAKPGRSAKLAWAAVEVFAALGAALRLYAADLLTWAFSDSVEHPLSARDLVRGQGLGSRLPELINLHPKGVFLSFGW